jgi:hypothetical protein
MTGKAETPWQRSRRMLGRSINRMLVGTLVVGLLLSASGQTLAQEGGWSTPVMISTNTISSWFPDVAVDAWGQPHVVWNSGRPAEPVRMDLLMYSTLADEAWLEPNDIALTAYGGYTVRPAVAVDSAGTLHVTFRGEVTVYYTRAPVAEAWSASAWTPRRGLSGAGNGTAYYSDVAADEQGDIHVVWNEGVYAGVGERWLWFGTPRGGALYDGHEWRLQEPEAGLGNREVYAIIEDDAGVQWFGTDEGVYRFDGGTWQRFTVHDGLVNQKVNCLVQDLDGRLWFGTDGGISRYEEKAQRDEWNIYTTQSGLPGNVVHAMAIDDVGLLWAGTDRGLASYDGQDWTRYTPQDGLVAAEVLAVAVDTQGDIWAGTGQGVSRYDGRQWMTYTVESGLLSNVVTAITVDHEGAIWFGMDRGLSRFDGQAWTSYTAADGLGGGAVTALMVDSERTIWVGSEEGVSRYDGRAWEPIEFPQAFAGQRVTAIAEDRRVNAICNLCADIFYRHSTDRGRRWSAPVNLSGSFAGSVKPQVRVGSGGSVYVTWEEGEDWYIHEGYPVASMFVYSPDGGNTWTEPTVFSSPVGAPQQITLGVGQDGALIAVWRLPEEGESSFYYQLSTDDGATWSEPQPIPGVIAKPWEEFSLDAYDAATDSAGHIHLLVLGHRFSLEEDLGLFHLVWNGSEWSLPALIFASSDPPEWPRIDVGVGNQVYATWFTRDEEHIKESERGRYKVWVSYYQASAPPQTPVPLPTLTPTPALATAGRATSTPIPTPTPVIVPGTSGLPAGLDTESDEIGQLLVALSPVAGVLLIIVALRFGRFKRRG